MRPRPARPLPTTRFTVGLGRCSVAHGVLLRQLGCHRYGQRRRWGRPHAPGWTSPAGRQAGGCACALVVSVRAVGPPAVGCIWQLACPPQAPLHKALLLAPPHLAGGQYDYISTFSASPDVGGFDKLCLRPGQGGLFAQCMTAGGLGRPGMLLPPAPPLSGSCLCRPPTCMHTTPTICETPAIGC